MNLSRRSIMMGLACGGIALPLLGRGSPLLSAALRDDTPVATLALVPQASGSGGFALAARSATRGPFRVQVVRDTMDGLRALAQALQAGAGMRVLGLLDDAIAIPLLDVARGAGARMQWLGQHVSDASGGCQHLLGTADGEVRTFRLAATAPLHGVGWDAELGALLASRGLAPSDLPAPVAHRVTAPIGSFVSFLAQT